MIEDIGEELIASWSQRRHGGPGPRTFVRGDDGLYRVGTQDPATLPPQFNRMTAQGAAPIGPDMPVAEPAPAPAAPATLDERMQQDFGMDPKAERTNIIPNPNGSFDPRNWTAPEWLYSLLRSIATPGHVMQGGEWTPEDARSMAVDVGMGPIVGSAPAGALTSGAARRGAQGVRGADAVMGAGAGPVGHEGRISTRLPTAVKATENPVEQALSIDINAMKMDPEQFAQNVGLVKAYPGIGKAGRETADQTAERFVEHVKGNLLFLFDQVDPAIRERSKLWYDGARKITDDWSAKYDVPDTSVAGVLAALSPQKDWFQNVSLAERVLEIYTGKNAQRFDQKMMETANRIFGKPQYKDAISGIAGKTLGELTDPVDKAIWTRVYDQTFNSPAYKVVAPEGSFADVARNMDGKESRVAWGSLVEISKAIRSIEVRGDKSELTRLMGEKHKVRNFYNNILDPNGPQGDVTIDTHAVAAGLLRPLSGNSLEVAHNFENYAGKGMPSAAGSSLSGARGTYGLYADAYRRAAAERGVLPREMQSITWEAVRGLFPDTFKTAANMDMIATIWQDVSRGKLTADEARARILAAGNRDGINAPAWLGTGGRPDALDAGTRYPADAGELPRDSVFRGGPGSAAGGTGSRAAGNVPPVKGARQPRRPRTGGDE